MIIACGIVDKGVACKNAVMGREVDINKLKQPLVKHVALIFTAEPNKITMEDLPWS